MNKKKIIGGIIIILIALTIIFLYLTASEKVCPKGKIRQFSNCTCSYQCNDSYQDIDCMRVCPNEKK